MVQARLPGTDVDESSQLKALALFAQRPKRVCKPVPAARGVGSMCETRWNEREGVALLPPWPLIRRPVSVESA